MNDLEIEFLVNSDDRGKLVSLESGKNIPFEIKRVYYIYDTKDVSRGFHAHKNLQQVLICISGSCVVTLDDGEVKKEFLLKNPNHGLYVGNMVWREMHDFSDNCVLMVLANDYYNEKDYIKEYDSFLSELNKNSEQSFYKHDTSIVESNSIGKNTTIWAYSHVFPGAVIGENCNINDHTLIENDVVLGNNVTIKSGVHMWDGVRVENNVFIGPSVVFTNDLTPRSKRYPSHYKKTYLKENSSIGANVTIVAGVTIGEYAMIGAGAVVTKNVPPHNLWYGNPAKFRGYVCTCGSKLSDEFYCNVCDINLTETLNKYKG